MPTIVVVLECFYYDSIRSSLSQKDKGACNSPYYQHERQNSNMAERNNNSVFPIRIKSA